MGKLYLVGHTGSVNRGCEAIVRSTVSLFNKCGVTDITLFSDKRVDDKKNGLDAVCKIYQTHNAKRYSIKKFISRTILKTTGQYMPEEKLRQWNNMKMVSEGDTVFVIGGDTYCYGRATANYAANKLAKRRGAYTVLWGCSIEKNLVDDEMKRDLMSYDAICPREDITYQTLKELGIPDYLTCLLRTLYSGQDATVRTRHGTMDWFQTGKGVHKGCILSPCYLTSMQSTSCKRTGWMKHKLE